MPAGGRFRWLIKYKIPGAAPVSALKLIGAVAGVLTLLVVLCIGISVLT